MSRSDDDYVVVNHEHVESPVSALPHDDMIAIKNWLDPSEYDDGASEYVKHLRSHLGGTGDWIEGTQEYQSWHSASEAGSKLLWIKAIAGAGKSVLAARTRARLARNEGVPVLHFFFRQIVARNRTPKQLVRDWLAQLLPFSPFLQHKLNEEVMDKAVELDVIGFDTLWGYFRQAAATCPRIYCFADALDEMSFGNDTFLGNLLALGSSECCRVFVTSRPVHHIVAGFRNCTSPPLCISLRSDNMNEDISKYVDHRLEHDIGRYIDHRLAASRLAFPDADGEGPTFLIVRETLKSKAQGSFLYARLMTDNLLSVLHEHGNKVNKQHLRDKLDILPAGLGNMYASMLQDHAERTATPLGMQLSILQWVTHSERPLRLLELATIIGFETKSAYSSKPTKSKIRTACGPLLEILPSDVVGPIHHSFTEFLVHGEDRQYHIDPLSAHRTMAKLCLSYLNGIDLREAKYLTVVKGVGLPDMERIALSYPFAAYAAIQWPEHFRKAKVIGAEVFGMVDELLNGIMGNKIRKELSQIAWESETESATLLHIAAALGLSEYADYLIASGHDVEVEDAHNRTALFYASKHGWPEIVSQMLRLGADGHTADSDGFSPLHVAASRNHAEVVKVLLNHGIDPAIPKSSESRGRKCGSGRTRGTAPFNYACSADHADTLKAFIPFLNTAQLTEVLKDAFHDAQHSESDYSAVHVLIEADALDVNEPFKGATPLYWASRSRDIVGMKMLLRRGAKAGSVSEPWAEFMGIMATKPHYEPILPIHAFCSDEKRKVLGDDDVGHGLELLLSAGNSIDAEDNKGYAPLHYAQTSWQTSRLLLELGASIKAISRDDHTPLHRITAGLSAYRMLGSHGENLTVVASGWLSHGVNINARNPHGETAMMLLCQGDFGRSMNFSQTLLKQQPDLEVADNQGKTALHFCAGNRFRHVPKERMIRNLLEAGANPNALTSSGDTALHLCQNLEGLEVLVEGGADIEARNAQGATVLLMRAAEVSCVRELLRLGSRVDCRDLNGETCLHRLFLQAGHRKNTALQAFDLLTENGADHAWLDSARNSMWHCAASKERQRSVSGLWQRLRCINKDHDQPNAYGQTPFFVSIAAGNTEFAAFLELNKLSFDVDCRDVLGRAPIHLAACISEVQVKRLLDLGADIRARTADGWTALHFAAQARLPNVVLYLLELAPKPIQDLVHVKDVYGRTALDLAARSGVSETVDILLDANVPRCGRECAAALSYCLKFPEEDQRWDDAMEKSRKASEKRSCMSFAGLIEMLHMKDTDDLVLKLITTFHYRGSEIKGVDRINLVKIRQCLKRLIEICRITGIGLPEELQTVTRAKHDFEKEETWQNFRQMVYELLPAFEDDCDGDTMMSFQGPDCDASSKMNKSVVQTNRKQRLQVLHDLKSEGSLTIRAYGSTSAHLVPQMYDSETELWSLQPAWRSDIVSVPQVLVRVGAYDALRELGVKFGLELARDVLTDALLQRVFRHHSSHIKAFDTMPNCWDVILLEACRYEDPSLETVKVLLGYFPISSHGLILAVFALVENGEAWHIHALNLLLKQGVDPMARDMQGRTALHVAYGRLNHKGYASQGLSFLAVKSLLQHGADPNILDFGDGSSSVPDSELVSLLVEHGLDLNSYGHPILLGAIRANCVPLVRTLVAARVPLNLHAPTADAAAAKGATSKSEDSLPLYISVSVNADRNEIQSLLLEFGADPNILLPNGSPLIHQLVGQYDPLRAQKLLDYRGLNLSQRDSDGRTLLLVLAKQLGCHQYHESYPYLLDLISRGAAIEARDNRGENLLHLLQGRWLSSKNEAPLPTDNLLVKMCQERGLINAVDDDGMRPIHHCLRRQDWKCAEMLVSHGAEYTYADPEGNNAFHHLACGMITKSWCTPPKGAFEMRADAEQRMACKESSIENKQAYERSINEEQDAILQEYWRQEESRIRVTSRTLHDEGVDIALRNNIGEPPLFTFMRNCHNVYTPYHYNGRDEKINASQTVLIARLNLLIAAGADLHAKAAGGQNALHALATCRAQEVDYLHSRQVEEEAAVQFMWKHLAAQGIDPYLEDDEQRTALDIAAVHGNTMILELY